MLPGRSLIGQFQALESAGLVALGAAGIALGRPHLANGANLAFRAAAFHAVGGYRGVDHIASGDDELLLQRMGRSYPGGVAFALLREAIVDTPASQTWAELRRQRIRWVSKGRAYADAGLQRRLVLAWLAHFALLGSGVAAYLAPHPWMLWALVGLGLKCIAELAVLVPALRFMGRKWWLVYFLPEQLVYIPFVVWAGLRGLWVRPYVWRGRVVE
jgi:cellulose synthase/poly-beta-1,6-N-acetylglucosamine synthase-like glycosyltransferase